MRANQEDTNAFNTLLKSGRFSHDRKVLTDDVVITQNGPLVNFLKPNGANRLVTLPPLEGGRFYVVVNIGNTNNLIVQSANALTVTTLLPGDSTLLCASDAEWAALRGWAALGVFTNTINGLVPAPVSAVPGSLFLRDDGQWGQVQVTGIVDAFKFITDGTTTAIGSGPDTFKLRSSTGKIGITVQNNDVTHGDNANFTVNEGAVNHNALLNYVADQHVAHSGVVINPGTGMSGGGDITASRTLNFNPHSLTVTAAPVLTDYAVMDLNAGGARTSLWSAINAIFVHNNLFGYVANEHINHTGVSIVAGTGLTGGGDITSSRMLSLDIAGLSSDTPTLLDSFAFFDVSQTDTNKATFSVLNGIFDHNSLLNYVANQHIDHTSVSISAGTGLTGGGNIAANRTLSLANIAANTVLGNNTGGSAAPTALTQAQLTALVNTFTNVLSGAVPASGGGTSAFLRADGTWAAPAGSGTVTNVATGEGLTGGPITTTGTVAIDVALLRGYLSGLALSTAGASTTFSVAVGVAVDSTNAVFMKLASALSKTTSAWAVGSGNGSLDTGTIAASTWYHAYLIKRLDTGVVDVLISLSASAPTLPTNYTVSRRIGSMKTNGSSQWTKFVQDGDTFTWDAPVNDVSVTNPGNTAVLRTLSVPTGLKVRAIVAGYVQGTIGSDSSGAVYLSDPSVADTAAGQFAFTFMQYDAAATGNVASGSWAEVFTNTSAQVRSRLAISTAGTLLTIDTMGWTDRRGRDG